MEEMSTVKEKDHPELDEVGQDVRTDEVLTDSSGAQSSGKIGLVEDLRDPDEGKSDEESARLVSIQHLRAGIVGPDKVRTALSSGRSINGLSPGSRCSTSCPFWVRIP